MAGEGSLPYVSPLESVRLGSLPAFAEPPKGRVISSSLNGIAVKRGYHFSQHRRAKVLLAMLRLLVGISHRAIFIGLVAASIDDARFLANPATS